MLKDFNFAFFGSPRFAQLILERLVENGITPSVVICNPDKPFGRKKIITPPPIKQLILDKKMSIKILQPANKEELSLLINDPDIKNCKFALVVAYSRIIPQPIIDTFPMGIIGVHPSLLPRWRGSSPIQWSILNGDKETGTSIYLIDSQMDHGSVLDQERLDISDNFWNYTKLEEALAYASANSLIRTLPLFIEGKITPKPQDETQATFTKKFVTEDGYVDVATGNPMEIYRKIMALNPEPGTFCTLKGKRTKLLDASLEPDGSVTITKIQPEGKKPQPTALKLPLT
jgi:methionyl-tRNA formyltransferase